MRRDSDGNPIYRMFMQPAARPSLRRIAFVRSTRPFDITYATLKSTRMYVVRSDRIIRLKRTRDLDSFINYLSKVYTAALTFKMSSIYFNVSKSSTYDVKRVTVT